MKKNYIIKYVLLFLYICIVGFRLDAKKADIIIFSYDRPIQFKALLDSLGQNVRDLNKIFVIYRTSSCQYSDAYNKCFKLCPKLLQEKLVLKKQGDNARANFKPLVLDALRHSKSEYVLFAVDDIIVKDYISLSDCINYLEKTGAYVFHLRMGKNITKSYTMGIDTGLPPLRAIDAKVISWKFNQSYGEWRYPNSLDMGIYKKNYVLKIFSNLYFTSPNTLEAIWADQGPLRYNDLNKTGLCYIKSKTINVPLNRVQTDWNQALNMNIDKEYLLAKFNDGYIIDISKYKDIKNTAPHMPIEPVFIKR